MKHTTESIGQLIKSTRVELGITQKNLALSSGTGIRFIIELEQGKPTCELKKVLDVINTLGIKIHFEPPSIHPKEAN